MDVFIFCICIASAFSLGYLFGYRKGNERGLVWALNQIENTRLFKAIRAAKMMRGE